MQYKKWFVPFVCTGLLVFALIAIFNVAIDPFGIFRDPIRDLDKYVEKIHDIFPRDPSDYTAAVPILMYHHLAEPGNDSTVISPQNFESHIEALVDAGYTAVSFEELVEYVEKGTSLPEKPIVITLDDGYLSNYEVAYPILQKYDMKATIFVIGVSMGKNTYKDTGIPICPHFSYEQAAEMVSSELISVQSHSYDMHQWPEYEEDEARIGVLPMDGETEDEYIEAFRSDTLRSISEIEAATGQAVITFAYPYGHSCDLSETLLRKMGFKVTLPCPGGTKNIIIKGLPQSLYGLVRYGIADNISASELIEMLED